MYSNASCPGQDIKTYRLLPNNPTQLIISKNLLPLPKTTPILLEHPYLPLRIYLAPLTDLGFINIIVVVVRLCWFEKRLKQVGEHCILIASPRFCRSPSAFSLTMKQQAPSIPRAQPADFSSTAVEEDVKAQIRHSSRRQERAAASNKIAFAEGELPPRNEKALRVSSPGGREMGRPLEEHFYISETDDDKTTRVTTASDCKPSVLTRRPARIRPSMATAVSIERRSKLPSKPHRRRSASISRSSTNLPYLSNQRLGGIEYRSLKLLLKIVIAYFFGLNRFRAICLAGWIQTADSKYRDYLVERGQDKTWRGFYSAQSMGSNLGFTLTPDSMITSQDATLPLFMMSFLAYAGNKLYPCLSRLVIWTMAKPAPRHSVMQEPLNFLLEHPRRCYTLLFPSRTTWILFGITFVVNFIDTPLVVVLGLQNPAVNNLPGGARLLAALLQAASSRHMGTATFDLAEVHPAVQFSLLLMIVRASNTYEDRSLGMYAPDPEVDEITPGNTTSYLLNHLPNQLGFDLWSISLGILCITIAEADRIIDQADSVFQVFPVFFEVVSAYGNIGLSLGYRTFTTFSRLVICAIMI
ncbi:putative cation transporter [Macrophomina phaseolina]|uniref:Cation transporter n=1 Tax=Macrophomina phaseolina TaxID=35725 RepID=A0ABQ8FTL8_9PEZI|nr:putative cation transporter [Macrophomina phaseolina]